MSGRLIAVFLWVLSGTAWAQSNDDRQGCSSERDPDLRIHYCTRLIQSGQLSNENLPLAFNNRGNAYSDKKQYDRAIADFDRAIALDPNYAAAFNNRGNAYSHKKQYDRAIEDYDRAIRLDPNYAAAFNNRGNAYDDKKQHDRAIEDYDRAIRLDPNFANAFYNRGVAYDDKKQHDRAIEDYDRAIRLDPNNTGAITSRGRARFYLGRFSEAQADLARAVEIKPDDAFAVIWHYLARARAGQDGKAELSGNAGRLKLESWPGPVVKLYLGTATTAAVMAAAKDGDAQKDREQHCEAYFYLGQQALLRGDRAEAIKLFKAAVATSVTNFVEYTGAQAELKRLGVQ